MLRASDFCLIVHHQAQLGYVSMSLAGNLGRYAVICAVGCIAFASSALPASARVAYEEILISRVLPCLHPTARRENARVEQVTGPITTGEMTRSRHKIYYQGLIRRNVAEVELLIRQSGSIRQMMVNVLSDSAPSTIPCSLTSRWTDF